MIDSILFTELFEIFPESFSVYRKFIKYEYEATPWGMERREVGEGTESLAEDILFTAQAMCKGDINRGLRYLQVFKKKSVQNGEIKKFTA